MTWPTYAKIAIEGYSTSESAIAERTEMDRGVPKQRKTQSDVIVTVSMKLWFDSKSEAIDFRDWYYSPTGASAGTAYFDWADPVDGVTYQARAVANTLGPITPVSGALKYFTRTLQIEYRRAL